MSFVLVITNASKCAAALRQGCGALGLGETAIGRLVRANGEATLDDPDIQAPAEALVTGSHCWLDRQAGCRFLPRLDPVGADLPLRAAADYGDDDRGRFRRARSAQRLDADQPDRPRYGPRGDRGGGR